MEAESMSDSRFVPVVAADKIKEKKFECFTVDGIGLVVGRFRDEYFAVENMCSHALATFDDGRMRGYRLMCPLHGATFDIRDGSVTGAPATRPIKAYALRIVDGMVEVDITQPTPAT
jgi:nitrite reductase/ring-hydroxylating ferredoxin subunit